MIFSKEELEFLDDAIDELISKDYWDDDETKEAFLLWDKVKEELKHLDDI